MGCQVTRAASSELWSVPWPSGTAQMSLSSKKEQSACFPPNFTGCWSTFENSTGIRHSASIPAGSAGNFRGKAKHAKKLEARGLTREVSKTTWRFDLS